ncbi:MULTISPECIES: ROK family protein [unclassified Halanaerobium]|uniref:ROK family protein n=1 Tax=unclassified Halanaerobium TaxID=2641197 RepID=UPI000DF42771|nr:MULTISPECIES: ROK family protein [unclassified Halanaerobium]RCW45695.1 glucokinase [Halanaerobium sp. MA284_MarDTE_T2]RCW88067.1 glucokinase [Halanaerobium sp. DL-01]
MSEYYLGIDLGGTKILTGLGDGEGNILASSRRDTQAEMGEKHVINNIFKTVEDVLKKAGIATGHIKALGIGSPGPLDIKNGIIVENSNLPWKKVHIVEIIENKFNIKTVLENDANAAALAEKWFGAGRDVDDMVYLTISTGIGGGSVIKKELFSGYSNNACEIGHTVIDPNGPLCGCGNHGCLESFASGKSISRMAKEAVKSKQSDLILELADGDMDKIDAAVCAEAARKGDKTAAEIFSTTGFYLGIGLGNVVNIFNPQLIVLGGGVMKASDLFLDKALEVMHQNALDASLSVLEVKKAELGDKIGLMGALAVAMKERLIKNG